GNRIQFGKCEVSELPREDMNQLVFRELEEREWFLTLSHQHGNQMNGLNPIRIEQLFPAARILKPNRHPEVEHSPPRPAQLPQVLFDFSFPVSAILLHFQVFDLPDDRDVVKYDQQVTEFLPVRLFRVRIAPVSEEGFRREVMDDRFGSLSLLTEIVARC